MIKQKSLKLNAGLNVIKQLCQVIFPLITIPYVTRVLGPDSYGIFNYGNSIVSYFALVAALGINSYAVRDGVGLREDKEKLQQFASEVFSINIVSTIISYLLLFSLLLISSLAPYRKVIAVQSLVIILTTVGTDWINTIFEDYSYITIRYIAFQIVSLLCMFSFVHSPDDYLKYAMVVVGAQAGANILNIFHVRKYVKIRVTKNIEWSRHLKPIVVFFANIVAITIYVNSDITMLGILTTDRDVGIYTLSSRIYTIVKQIINAIMVVTLPRLSLLVKTGQRRDFNDLLIKVEKAILLLVFPATIGMAFLSKQIILIVSGEEYVAGASALIILSLAIPFSLLATFYTSCVMVPLKLERYVLIATTTSALSNIVLNYYFIPVYGFNGAAITTLVSEGIVFGIGLIVSTKNGKPIISLIFILKVLAGSIFVGTICLLSRKITHSDVMYMIVAVALSVPLYFLFEIIIKNEFMINEGIKTLCSVRDKMRNRL